MKSRCGQGGFGLLETLVAIGLLALIVVLSYPGYKRTGLLAKAEQLRAELQAIEKAVTAANAKLKAPAGTLLTFEQIAPHLTNPSPALKSGLDPLGHPYGPQRTDRKPTIPSKSAEQLRGAVSEGFWGGYFTSGEL